MTRQLRSTPLKRDPFGAVSRLDLPDGSCCALRDTNAAAWWASGIARWLAGREALALSWLPAGRGLPRLLSWDGRQLRRSWLAGRPMQAAQPRDPRYFSDALRLLRSLHAAGIVHNDLAKEPNWLVDDDGRPGLVDFQLAMRPRMRGRRFRALAWDDLRHLLKHKRTYCPDRLTARQRRILEQRSWLAQAWAASGKPVYRFVTRGLFGWSDREGARDRGASHG